MDDGHSVVYMPEQKIQFQLQRGARVIFMLSSQFRILKTPTLIPFSERRRKAKRKESPSLVFAATNSFVSSPFPHRLPPD